MTLSVRSDHITIVTRALGWVRANLSEFDPFLGGRSFHVRFAQRVCELATMVYCYRETTGDVTNPHIQECLALLRDVLRRPEFHERVLRFPAEFGLFSDAYAVLRLTGVDEPEIREILQRAIDAGVLDHVERQPHRLMDVRLSLEWGGFSHHWLDLDRYSERSILASIPNPLYLDEGALYAFTHVILFRCGFGTRPLPPQEWVQDDGLQRKLSLLFVAACQEHQWDLLMEFLLCWDCLGYPETELWRRSWQTLVARQTEDGAFPGPESALNATDDPDKKQTPEEIREASFSYYYHTTLLAVIAGCLRDYRAQHPGPALLPRAAVRPRPCLSKTAVTRAYDWLDQLHQAEVSGPPRPDTLCRIFLGASICRQLDSDLGSAFKDLSRKLAQRMPTGATDLLAHCLFEAEGIHVQPLVEYSEIAASALRAHPPESAWQDLQLYDKRFLLHKRRRHPEPLRVSYSEVIECARKLDLSAAEEIEELVLAIQSLTACGTESVGLRPEDEWLAELLVALATHLLRQYDLLLACRLLRAVNWLGFDVGDDCTNCLDFLRAHQRIEGSFGFYGPEEAGLRSQLSGDFAAGRDLSLPTTITCLWTLAEATHPNWRLYSYLQGSFVHKNEARLIESRII